MIQLAKKEECTGCSACVQICPKECIQMVPDQYGFYYPKMIHPENCIECRLCEKHCEVIVQEKMADQKTLAYASYTKNSNIIMESTSGGLFSEMANYILQKKGVIYGAVYDEKFDVYHKCVTEISDLCNIRGAKYAQSNLKDCFKDIKKRLKSDQWVLFSGTPCQVAGLKKYLEIEYDKLITVDFICHGIPSPMVWKKYVNYRCKIENNGNLPKKINMRSKISGWSHYNYSTMFEYSNDKKTFIKNKDDLYMKLFIGDYISRECCSDCRYKGYDRYSDITLGDFWGIWDIIPELDNSNGISAMLVHTNKGKHLIKECESNIKNINVELSQVSKENPSILYSSKRNDKRDIILKKISCNKWKTVEKKIENRSNIINKIIMFIKK